MNMILQNTVGWAGSLVLLCTAHFPSYVSRQDTLAVSIQDIELGQKARAPYFDVDSRFVVTSDDLEPQPQTLVQFKQEKLLELVDKSGAVASSDEPVPFNLLLAARKIDVALEDSLTIISNKN